MGKRKKPMGKRRGETHDGRSGRCLFIPAVGGTTWSGREAPKPMIIRLEYSALLQGASSSAIPSSSCCSAVDLGESE